jgi:hypothetical protein
VSTGTIHGLISRFALCLALLPFHAAHAQILLLDDAQTRPGLVTVQLQSADGSVVKPGDLSLKFANPPEQISASRLTVLPDEPTQTALMVCIDRSASMGAAGIEAVASALRQTLIPSPGAGVPFNINIVTFSAATQHLTSGFTTDPAKTSAALSNLRLDSGKNVTTQLDDAIAGAIAELRASGATYRRLLVISGGANQGSDISESALLEQAAAAHSISVDTVGYGAQAAFSSGVLAKLSATSGGQFVMAENPQSLLLAIEKLVRDFADVHRYQAEFTYAPAAEGHASAAAQLLYQGRSYPLSTQIAAIQPKTSPGTPESEEPVGKLALKLLAKFKFLLALSLTLVVGVTAVVERERIRVFILRIIVPVEPPTPPQPSPSPSPPPQPRLRKQTRVGHSWPLPNEGATVAILESRGGSTHGRRWNIVSRQFRIGSAGDNDLVLDRDEFASAHHAVIKADAHGLYLTDLDSRNGTRVNGDLIKATSRPLLPGDEIAVGQTVFEVCTAVSEDSASLRNSAQRAR